MERPFEAVLAFEAPQGSAEIAPPSMPTRTDPLRRTAPMTRPRGRPPFGAVLGADGVYRLPPESIQAAAERILKHRADGRARYKATRDALKASMPDLFTKSHERGRAGADLRRFECTERGPVPESIGEERNQSESQGR